MLFHLSQQTDYQTISNLSEPGSSPEIIHAFALWAGSDPISIRGFQLEAVS